MFNKLPAVVLLASTMMSCTSAPASPTTNPSYSQTDIVPGTGATANTGAAVTVDYTGWLYDASKPDQKGLQFDSSIGRMPFTFTLGGGTVIKGWDQGVPGMLVGGQRRLIIPPSLGYGDTRSGIIPPDAALVFDITLLSVQ